MKRSTPKLIVVLLIILGVQIALFFLLIDKSSPIIYPTKTVARQPVDDDTLSPSKALSGLKQFEPKGESVPMDIPSPVTNPKENVALTLAPVLRPPVSSRIQIPTPDSGQRFCGVLRCKLGTSQKRYARTMFSPDGKWIACVPMDNRESVELLSIESGERIAKINAEDRPSMMRPALPMETCGNLWLRRYSHLEFS